MNLTKNNQQKTASFLLVSFHRSLFLFLAALASAMPVTSVEARALDNSGMVPLITIGSGVYNVLRTKNSALFEIQYRPAIEFFKARPFVGSMFTSRGALNIYAGIGWDLHMTPHLVLTPSFAPGVYVKGSDKDLGYPLEFRSCVDLAYQWDSKARMGIQFYHLSNASIGDRNPGAEGLSIYYAIPLNH